VYPDILHSYFSLAGISMMGLNAEELEKVDPALGMTVRASPNPKVGVIDVEEWLKSS
jgi:prenyltransferase beta subunit